MSRSAQHDERNNTLRALFSNPDEVSKGPEPTAAVVEAKAKDVGIAHEIEDVPNGKGARLHWLGDRAADKVLLYFHGGGFGMPAFPGHVLFMDETVKKQASKGEKLVVAFLEYTLTKESKYPVQIGQATEALRTILSHGYKPSQVYVGGDSAGGNLTLALASHIHHPLEGLPSLKLDEPLGGLILISPWVSFETDTQSWTDNISRDIIGREASVYFANEYAPPEERNNHIEPFRAPASWWENLPVKRVLNLAGGYECFLDHIVAVGQRLAEAGVQVETVECPMQVHIDCILDIQSGLEPAEMSFKIWEWL